MTTNPKTRNFKLFWFSDCQGDEEKIEERRKKLLQFSEICGIIRDVMERKLEALESVTEKDYDNPSWAFKQAHINGEQQAYRDILTLLEFPVEEY